MFTFGASSISRRGVRSTFFCSARDSGSFVVALQCLGLLLDATIAILFWRVLAWTRTTRSRLKTLGGVLVASSSALAFFTQALGLFGGRGSGPQQIESFDSLYAFDIFADGFIFSILSISATIIVSEDGPTILAGTIVFLSGLVGAVQTTIHIRTWENIWRLEPNVAPSLLCAGFVLFIYTAGLRNIAFVGRKLLLGLLLILLITSMIFTLVKNPWLNTHPIDDLIYDTRVDGGRWLVHASISNSLRVAVQEYKDRNHGRDPPPGFDVWYRFAVQQHSPIIDHFAQIGSDILPFWAFPPDKIRQSLEIVASQPDIAIVKVENGKASHTLPQDSPHHPILEDLLDMMVPFKTHLPDMEFAVNLNERPRVLAPWIDTQRFGEAGKRHGLSKLLSRRSEAPEALGNSPKGAPPENKRSDVGRSEGVEHPEPISAQAFRQMTALTCPPGSSGRSGVHWDVRDFCSACAKPQSQGQFLQKWTVAQDLCHQPDLTRLHGFHTSPSSLMPIGHLLPVFSRSKTNSYSDILIPLRRAEEISKAEVDDDSQGDFTMKGDRLFWRGSISGRGFNHELLHGGHQERLVHLINNSTASDSTIMLISTGGREPRFAYESVPTAELNDVLPIDAGFRHYSNCDSAEKACEKAWREFGIKPEEKKAFGSRYVLLTDSDDGPPVGLQAALRSTSVPFVASVFKEWYSERLIPWLHFVPIDMRYHALHSTLAYFTGLKGRGTLNGQKYDVDGRLKDAKWIAGQGKRWAATAMRREDMEVYLFRLLLEWGRLVNDDRDKIGFQLG